MLDYHIHSNISADSKEEMGTYCEYALTKGVQEICFTEHLDIEYPHADVFLPDFDLYEKKITASKEKYTSLIIKKGIEVGLQPETSQANKAYLSGKEFDFIIASQHVSNGNDLYYADFSKSKTEVFAQYLQAMYESLIQYDFYNVVGHIGYPSKFCPYDDKVLHYSDYCELLDEILKHVINAGKGVEVNTSSFVFSGADMPDKTVLKRYRELNGEIITFGSDAHKKERLGDGYKRVLAALKDLGFRYICTFEKMKPKFNKI